MHVSDALLDEYLAGIDARLAPIARAVDAAILAGHGGLETRINYSMLMYTLPGGNAHNFVCAIDTTKRGVCLRFLYGARLADPKGVLRGGKSHLSNWDIGTLDEVDAPVIAEYVAEAASRHAEFRSARPGTRADT